MSESLAQWRLRHKGQIYTSKGGAHLEERAEPQNVLDRPNPKAHQVDFCVKGIGAGYFDKAGNLRTNAAFHVSRRQLDRTTGLRKPGSTIERPLRGAPRMVNKANISTRL